MPKFSLEARARWNSIPEHQRAKILENVWCSHCSKESTIEKYTGTLEGGVVILEGSCRICAGKVARVIEGKEKQFEEMRRILH